MPMPNELIEKWTELNQDNLKAIKQFSENYSKVMNHLTQPQMETAALEKAIKKLSENHRTITDLTRRQMEMVDGYMGEAAEKTVEAIITIAGNYPEQLEDAVEGAIHGGEVQSLHRHHGSRITTNTIHGLGDFGLQQITATRADRLTPRLLSIILTLLCPNGPHNPPCGTRVPATN